MIAQTKELTELGQKVTTKITEPLKAGVTMAFNKKLSDLHIGTANLNVAQSLLRGIRQARSDSKALTDKLYRVSQRRASIWSFGPPSWTCASAFSQAT